MRRQVLVCLLTLTASLSCHENVTLPPVQGPPLTIPELQSAARAQELKIVNVTPGGQLTDPQAQITVSFNKPMVSLEQVEERASAAPLSIKPEIPGHQRWLGSRTLTFVPDRPLPGSSSFSLELPAGIRAVDGSALKEGKSWSFTTPLLKVTRVSPSRNAAWQRPDAVVELAFNQPVAPRTLEKHARFLVRSQAKSAPLALAVQARRGKSSRQVVLRPATAFPLQSHVELQIDPRMTGQEGAEAMGAPYSTRFKTYGPFRIDGLSCTTDCDPEESVVVNFSNPVPRNDARRALRVNGAKLKPGSSTYASANLYLEQRLGARRRYAVTLQPGLKDKFGQTIQGKRTMTFTTGDFPPRVTFPLESGVLEASGPRDLPITFRNASSARLWSKPLTVAEAAELLGHKAFWDTDKLLLGELKGSKQQELKVAGQPNREITRRVNLNRLLGGKQRGLLAIELETTLPGQKTKWQLDRRRTLVRITDLGITAKYSPHATILWVTSLSTGRPVPHCAVSIWRKGEARPLWSGQTDAAGLAQAPGVNTLEPAGKSRSFLFFAAKGEDVSYVASQTQSGISPWDFGLDEAWDDGKTALLGMIFTDRGIYRPGETLHLKGIVRQTGDKGLINPEGEKIKVTVTDSRGEELITREHRLSAFGSFHMKVTLPPGAALGRYGVVGKLGQGALYGSLRVEEYRPVEFKVAVRPERNQYTRGDRLTWTARGDYLFGAPMSGAGKRWTLSRSPSGFRPPGHEGYVTSDEIWWWGDEDRTSDHGFVAQGSGKLDARGEAGGAVPLTPPRMRGPQTYELEATITDISRQTVSARAAVTLHPGEFYLGAKPEETFLAAGKSLKAKVVAVTPGGKRRRGISVAGTLYRRTWTSVRKQGMGGSHTFINRPVESAAGSCALVTADRPRPCEVRVPKAGYYVLRLRAKDRRGNPLMTSFGVYASGPDYVPWKRDDESRIELVTDRKRYKVGQVARILVKSPYSGAHGLMTVERDGIYRREPLKLKRTSAWLEVPITEEMIPNAFVSVILVRGRTGTPRTLNHADPGQPAFKVGYVKLPVSQAQRALAVTVKPGREVYRPGEEVVVDLQVKDARGKGAAAELTIFAADEGVLSLIGYRTPDPMAIFYAERGLSVRTADNRIRLISRSTFGEKGNNPGGGGSGRGQGGEGVRRKFLSTPYFNPSVVTATDGQAQVRFKLPDNLTTYRIMAVATTAVADFGSAHAQVKVNKPLLLLPTLPRLVRVGDRFEAGVVVHNRSGRAGAVQVNCAASGIRLEGPKTRQITLSGEGSKEVRFAFTAPVPGEGTLRFSASLDDHRDALELQLPVELPLVMESVAAFGDTETAVAEGILPAGGIRRDVGGLEVAMASSALVGLKPSMEYLMDYPFECLEQTTSRMLPLVLLKELRQAFKLSTEKEIGPLIGTLIAKVEQLQRWDGGFAFWPSSPDSYPWASAYAAWGLHQARARGYRVSQQVLDNARGYLKSNLWQKGRKGTPPDLNVQAFLVHVLAELKAAPPAAISSLYEGRKALAAFGKSFLLMTLIRSRGDAQMIKTLTQDLQNHVQQTASQAFVEEHLEGGGHAYFHSDNRSTALALMALLEADPQSGLADKMVRHLLQARKDGRWHNTQETLYALLALNAYYQARERQEPAFTARVLLGQATLLEHEFKGRSLKVYEQRVAMKDLSDKRGVLGFIKRGRGRLHYSARLKYARQALPVKPWDEGFAVQRTYQRVPATPSSFTAAGGLPDSKDPGVLSVMAGDLVRITLRIIAPHAMSFVAVNDPLPAGLEAINFKLMTADSSLARRRTSYSHRSRRGSASSSYYTPFYHQELRDGRVQLFADALSPGVHTYVYLARATTVGSFVAAPTHVEQMYQPEVFGRTAAVTFEVKAP